MGTDFQTLGFGRSIGAVLKGGHSLPFLSKNQISQTQVDTATLDTFLPLVNFSHLLWCSFPEWKYADQLPPKSTPIEASPLNVIAACFFPLVEPISRRCWEKGSFIFLPNSD